MPSPTIDVHDAKVFEGNAGTSTAYVNVTLSAPGDSVVTVNYATSDGTATAGSDYTSASGTVTFQVGEVTQAIPITVSGDTDPDDGESFTFALTSPVNGTLGNASASVYITDMPQFSFAEPEVFSRYYFSLSDYVGGNLIPSMGGGPVIKGADLNSDGSRDMLVLGGYYNNISKTNNFVVWKMFNRGDGTFKEPVSVGVSSYQITDLDLGDLNNDGHTDMVFVSYGSTETNGYVYASLNDGFGNFTSSSYTTLGDYPQKAVVADLNNDSYPDIAVSTWKDYSGISRVKVLLNNGDGTFGAPVLYNTGYRSNGIAAGDFDGDSYIDIAVTNEQGDNVSILLNNGASSPGTFSGAIGYDIGDYPFALEAGDFNGDGRVDLAAALYYGKGVAVLLNNGSGFDTAVLYPAGFGGTILSSGDLNGDGYPDLLFKGNSAEFAIFLNQRDGAFSEPYYLSGATGSPTVDDVDGDGDNDILTTGETGMVLYRNMEENDRLLSPPSMLLGIQTGSSSCGGDFVASGNFNGDGLDDVMAVRTWGPSCNYSRVEFLRNDGDRNFTKDSSFTVGYRYGLNPVFADFSGDGVLDVASVTSGGDLTVWYNDGSGHQASTANPGIGAGSIAASDVDQDGDKDIVTASGGPLSGLGYYFTVVFNEGIGNLVASAPFDYLIPDDTFDPDGLVSGDLNNDGSDDLIFTEDGRVYPVISNGPASYDTSLTPYAITGRPREHTMVDVTGDGIKDLVVIIGNSVGIMNVVGDGTLTAMRYVPVGSFPMGIGTGDFDGDGDTDLTVSLYSDAVRFLMNNGSGDFTVHAFTLHTPGDTNWGAIHGHVAVADFDQDGAADLFALTKISQLQTDPREIFSWHWGSNPGAPGLLGLDFSPSSVVVNNPTTATVTLDAPAPPGGAVVHLQSKDTSVEFPATVSIPAGQKSASFIVNTTANSEGKVIAMASTYAGASVSGDFYVEPVYPIALSFSPATILGGQGAVGTVTLNGPARSLGLTVNITRDDYTLYSANSVTVPEGQTSATFDVSAFPTASTVVVTVTASTNDGGASNTITINPVDGGSVSYNPASTYTSSITRKVVAADIDGDNDMDLAMSGKWNNAVSTMKNNGAAQFGTAASHATGPYPYSIDLADLDGNGTEDMVVAIRGANNTDGNEMSVYLNEGDGAFLNSVTYPVGGNPESIAIGNFNGDAAPDVATGIAEGVAIHLNNGDGTFTEGTRVTGFTGTRKILVVDINSDGYDDLIAIHNQAIVRILRNNKDATFTLSASVSVSDAITYGFPYGLAAGDLNGDGSMDLAIAVNVDTYYPNKRLMLLFNNGFGGFTQGPVVYNIATDNLAYGNFPYMSPVIEDLDGDGDNDIAVTSGTNSQAGNLYTFLNDGTGLLELPVAIPVGIKPIGLIAEDLDGDGDRDIAVVHDGTSKVYVFLNDLLNQYLLLVSPAGTGTGTVIGNIPGIDCGSDCAETYDLGTSLSLTATPDVSSTFAGWSGDCNTITGDVCDVTIDTATSRTVVPTYDIKTLDITASNGAGGSISPSGAVSVNYGASRTFNITPQTGYHVLDVTVDGVSQGAITSYTFTNVTTAHTIHAAFEINTYTITGEVPGLYGSLSCTSPVTYWGTATCTATPDVGYHVSSLTDNEVDRLAWVSGNTYTISGVNASHTVVAAFEVNSYDITASAGANGSISPAGATSVTHGGTQGYTITPDSGYRVLNVLVDGAGQGAITSYTFTNVQAVHTIQASFELLPDSDGDGLADDVEASLGTSPSLKDTDSDGFDDGVEVELGSDPLVIASVPVEIVISDGGGLEGVERADGGSDSDNLDTASGNPVIDKEFVFTLTVNATSAPGSVKVYMTQRTNPVQDDFYGFDLTCTGDFLTGATCQYPTALGPANVHKYYFDVTMSEGTTVRYPLSGYLTGPQVQAITGFSILGVPRAVDYAGLDSLSALGSTRAYRWESSLGYYTGISGLSPVVSAEGYYVFSEAQTLPELAAYGDSPNAQHAYQLSNGWNLISNPYEGNVELGDVMVKKGSEPPVSWLQAVLNGWIINAIYYFNGEDWGSTYSFVTPQTGARLVPWLGYWVNLQVSDDAYYLIIPRP